MEPKSRTEIDYGDDWFSLTGPQLQSAELVRMTCRYRRDGEPTCFIYRDRRIRATVSMLQNQDERGLTTIGDGVVRIRQVEHILSALYGMHCSDTDITLEYLDSASHTSIAPPVAHLDAKDFTLAIRRSFTDRKPRGVMEVDRAHIFFEEGEEKDPSFVAIAPHGNLHITVHVNFPYFWGKQVVGLELTPNRYEQEICWARSFFGTPFPHRNEWQTLQSRFPGLIRDRHKHYRSIMIDYDNHKWLTPLFSDDEPARHKLLDFIGDLSLIGSQLNASIYVYKPHHQFNRHAAAEIARAIGIESSSWG